MNEIEKQMMLQLMNDVYSFMKAAAGKMDFENNTLWEEIVNLDQECGNYREVVVEIYFTDGKYIQLHNRSFESLINNRYYGDDIQLIPDENGQRFLSLGGLGTCTYEPTLKSKACLKCLYFTIIIFDLCRYLEYFSYLYTINQTE